MRDLRIGCPRCGADVPPDRYNTGRPEPCVICAAPAYSFVFPAVYRPDENTTRAVATAAGDAACFHHADKLAVAACDECGRFLCGLCDLEYNGRHLCAPCLESGRTATAGGGFEPRRIQYDGLALALALMPVVTIFLWVFTLFTAPAAIFLVVRYWRRPMSAQPRTRVRFVFAFLIAVSELVGWVFLFRMMFIPK